MKKSFCTWYNYLFALVGVGLVCAGSLIPYFAFNDLSKYPQRYICYGFLFGGVVLVGVGFIWQDLFRGWSRHKINDWDNKLPDEILNKAWSIFMPFLVGGIISLLCGAIMCIFIK